MEFAFAIQFLLIFSLKQIILAVLLPAVKIALDLKTQVFASAAGPGFSCVKLPLDAEALF